MFCKQTADFGVLTKSFICELTLGNNHLSWAVANSQLFVYNSLDPDVNKQLTENSVHSADYSMNPLFVAISFKNEAEAFGLRGLKGSLKST